jgi:FKBP12-rapamycin complex-associated protein
MQLFELVNTLLATDRETTNRQMAIQRYAIIPLSPHSGLIGWVSTPSLLSLHRQLRGSHACSLLL